MARSKLLIAIESVNTKALALIRSIREEARVRQSFDIVGPIRSTELASAVDRHAPDAVFLILDSEPGSERERELVALLGHGARRVDALIGPTGRLLLVSQPDSAQALVDLLDAALSTKRAQRAEAARPSSTSAVEARPRTRADVEREDDEPESRVEEDQGDHEEPADDVLAGELRALSFSLGSAIEALPAASAGAARDREVVLDELTSGNSADAPRDAGENADPHAHAARRSSRWQRVRDGLARDEAERACLLLAFAVATEPSARRAVELLGGGRAGITPELCRLVFGADVSGVVADFDECFAPRSGLRQHACLVSDGHGAWELDPVLARYVLDGEPPTGLVTPEPSVDEATSYWPNPAAVEQLERALRGAARERARCILITLTGPAGAGRRAVCARAFANTELAVVRCDVDALLAEPDFELAVRRFVRCARFGVVLAFVGIERLLADGRRNELAFLETVLFEHAHVALFVSTRAYVFATTQAQVLHVRIDLDAPRRSDAPAMWRHEAQGAGVRLDERSAAELGARFRLHPAAARAVLRDARDRAFAARSELAPRRDELFAAGRAATPTSLADYAQCIEPRTSGVALVLPEHTERQLDEFIAHVECAGRVLDTWGFDALLQRGSGVAALFSGPSGTGKTTAAEHVAERLGLRLWRIDLARILSRYIGETEKQLSEVFGRADASSILFFDEADALFGKRTEVRDSHDRYANVEVAHLLQLIEDYPGVAILATNLRGNMDEAFTRRLRFVIDFPSPDADARARIWRGSLPKNLPLADDVDLAFLGRRFEVSGGSIRNIAVNAAFLAAHDDAAAVAMKHFVRAGAAELVKLGQPVDPAQFRPYADCFARPQAPRAARRMEVAS